MNKPKKKRAYIKAEVKHRVSDECVGACAECRETASSKIQYHHIDEDPSNSTYENLLLLCAGCHTEFTSGVKSTSDAMLLKRMAMANKLPPRKNAVNSGIRVGENHGVVAQKIDKVTVNAPAKSKASPVLEGTIGADQDMRTYADYLVKKYIDWRKKSDAQLSRFGKRPKRAFSPGATHRILGEGFGVTNTVFYVSQNRFHDGVQAAQAKIERTVFGRNNRNRNYHTWEEHLEKRHGVN